MAKVLLYSNGKLKETKTYISKRKAIKEVDKFLDRLTKFGWSVRLTKDDEYECTNPFVTNYVIIS